MSKARTQLAEALRFLAAHPRLAGAALEILRYSPSLRRRLCRVAGGDSSLHVSGSLEPPATGPSQIPHALRG
jgi:hypothetical protein